MTTSPAQTAGSAAAGSAAAGSAAAGGATAPSSAASGTAAERRAALSLPYTRVDDVFIDGAYVPAHGTGRNPVTDPATGEVWGEVPDGSPEDVEAAVAAARRAFDDGPWPRLSPSERAAHLLRIADEIEARAEVLAQTNTRENGSPITETRGAAANAAGIFRYFASLAGYLEREDVRPFPFAPGQESVVRRDPVGVCALIAPWNFPINLVVIKLAPALLAGCTVVIKPASPTPLSIRFIVAAVAAAGVPAGVVNLVTGSGRMGDVLVKHPGVDKVAFTGSTPVGRRIAAACGELLRPVTLELGGKSSAIVLPDADLDAMSKVLIRSSMRNTGQTCYISTRILAPASRYEEVVEMATSVISAAPQGDPLDPTTVFGPSATKSQFDTVMGYVESGLAEGARATTGGRAASFAPGTGLEGGFFVEPTVFADVTPDMRVAREEIFGPVLTILKYDDAGPSRGVDEAVALANNTEFGLGGLVFSADQDAALAVADRVDTGSIGLNFFASNHSAPFGGRHDSGLGTEYGIEGLGAYLTYKSIHRKTR
ncbi:aldehyde dehydrogenase [Sinomonas cellulolyticus]|uniref:Aldehyde dehydrogenase family protein n=1 Tax=Sinomonas cellulolyticus TaxID=2801916 RepID=A0ABS1K393_9MICC|nr:MULTISPECIES: aldehyde dehydrogenase family protein [Sinomonas]MBL0706144.1 aldehyde dehydrogenase family protein [Sinomonas cellulolyticus]GHG55182.1 aldehyde dehydrogenase [Sinomonas sp. KCTC 49339]